MAIRDFLKNKVNPFQKIVKPTVDPELKKRLEERGQATKVKAITAGLPTRGQNVLSGFAESPVTAFTGGRQIARGLAGSIIAPEVNRIQEQNLATQKQFTDMIRSRVRSGSLNQSDKERYARMLGQMSNVDVAKEIPELQITNKQILGDAANLALTATTGFKPGTSAIKSFTKATPAAIKAAQATNKVAKTAAETARVAKYGTKGKVANVLLNRGKSAITNAAIGGGIMGGSKLAEGGTNEEAIKSAKMGAAISVAAPLAFEAGAKVIGKGTSLLYNKAAKPLASKVMAKLESVAAKTPVAERLSGASDESAKVMAAFSPESTLKQKAAEKILSGVKAVQNLPSKLTDRFAALRPYEKSYQGARLAASSAQGRAEVAKESLFGPKGAYAQYKDILPDIEKRIAIEDFTARAKDGQKVASGQSSEQLATALKQHQDIMGKNEPRVQEGLKIWNKFKDDFLQEMVDAGVKSKEDIAAMKAKYPTHFPHKVLFDEIDDIAKNALPNASLDTPHSGFYKAVGSERELEQLPFDALVSRLQTGYRIAENNKVLNDLIKEAGTIEGMKRLPHVGPGIIKKSKVGEEVISLFVNGKKREWVAPVEIATAVKNLDAERLPTVIRAIGRVNNVMKKLSTTYNIPFIAQNKLRDKQTAFITADAFIQDMVKQSGAKPTAVNLDSDELYKLWKKSGGSFGSIFDESKTPISKLSRKGWGGEISPYLNPAAGIRKVNLAVEESTRLGVFKKALQAGLDPKQAALVSRDATVDFSKMGSTMRTLNEIIPFLNARVQGVMNIARSAKLSPEKFAQAQMLTSVYPTMGLYSWNSRFDSYKNVPQYFKDGYWVIMTGEEEALDDNGEKITVPQFLTFRKGEAQQITSNPIEWFLAKTEGKDPRRASKMIANTVGNMSPVDVGIGGYQSKNPILGIISQLGPLGSIGVGLATNLDPYTGNKIVPESRLNASADMQFKKTTPQLTKEIANILGVAPAKLEFMINATGGASKDIQLAADLTEGAVKGEGLRTNPITDTKFGEATRFPVSKSFLRESTGFGSAQQQANQELKDSATRTVTDQNLTIKDEAERIFSEMNKLQTKDERLEFLKSQNPSEEVRKKISALKKSRQAVEVLTKQDPVDVRAIYIHQRLLQMKQDGVSKEDRVDFLRELEQTSILTKDVKAAILLLKQQ